MRNEDPTERYGLSTIGKRRSRVYWIAAGVVLAALVVLVFLRASPSAHSEAKINEHIALPVAVASVQRADVYNEVTVEAEFRPYTEVEYHAKVSGYLTNITVDIGDKVKAGQLLAEIEVPELKDEMDRALAAKEKVEADHRDAHFLFERTSAVEKKHPNLVAQQDIDTAEAKDRGTEAAINAAKAEIEKYQTMMSYTKITAPFDGVITHRYADPGALIQAGTASDTQSLPLVRISDNYRLRLDFPVSVLYVKDIQLGQPVEVKVESLGGRTFTGNISRFTRKVDEMTRKMVTEIEVPNPNLELVPGMYATVILKVDRHAQALTVPVEAISADRKADVYVLGPQDEVIERAVTLGQETPTRIEILQGLKEGDLVIVGSRAQIHPGQKVMPRIVESLAKR